MHCIHNTCSVCLVCLPCCVVIMRIRHQVIQRSFRSLTHCVERFLRSLAHCVQRYGWLAWQQAGRWLAWQVRSIFTFDTVVIHKKLEKQHEITEIHAQTKHRVSLVHVTLLAVLLMDDCSDGDIHANQHLHELRKCDKDGERSHALAILCSSDRKISIHNRMYRIVHRSKPNTSCNNIGVRVPAVQQDCGVVPPLKCNHRLLRQ